jgi:RimJ/RimL family protein N-acetyltransferase
MTSFETLRLLVRPLQEDDFDSLHALYADFELMQHITGRPRTLEETRARLEKNIREHEKYGFGLCAIIERSSMAMIGRGGLDPVHVPEGVYGDAAWMFRRSHWAQGLATEFAMALLAHAFANLQLTRIVASSKPENVASVRVIEKVGMRFVERNHRGVLYEALPADYAK